MEKRKEKAAGQEQIISESLMEIADYVLTYLKGCKVKVKRVNKKPVQVPTSRALAVIFLPRYCDHLLENFMSGRTDVLSEKAEIHRYFVSQFLIIIIIIY